MEGCIEVEKKAKNGYGYIGRFLAHRVVYEGAFGPIPKGMFICHKCDNPSCINIDHLFMGTPKDNTRDMIRKGRTNPRKGESHYRAILTESQAKEIIEAEGMYKDIAERYGVGKHAVECIKRGENWAHLDRSNLKISRGRTIKITPTQATEIRKDPRSHAAVANDYGVSHSTISQIRRRETFKYVE